MIDLPRQADCEQVSFFRPLRCLLFGLVLLDFSFGAEPSKPAADAETLHRKVLCGYQGWFRCPGDGTQDGWLHWSRDRNRLKPETLTVEMWPDLSEFSADEKFPVPGWTLSDREPAFLFSSAREKTVRRHFEWMRDYDIDGAFVQRFLVNLNRPSFDTVLSHVRKSSGETVRVYAVCYDLSGTPKERIERLLTSDWKRLVDAEGVTKDANYLHHEGKPVVFVWGFFEDRFDADLANRIIDFFQKESPYQATLIGGCQWDWRTVQDPGWAKAFRKLDVISPWNVGNYSRVDRQKWAATGTWKADIEECQTQGREFLPVIYPGFSWTNLKGEVAARQTIPRLKGEFYWRQFVEAAELDVPMVYVAMFDEVDEATAIFKVTNQPPTNADFATYEGLPADWYLRLTGEGRKLIRKEIEPQLKIPIRP